MSASPRWQHQLKWLLLATVAASILHYADNLLYFEQYPEPPWINRSMVDAFWFMMTPLAWIGYGLIRSGCHHSGTLALLAYAAGNLLSLGHYRYAPMCSIDPRINTLILLEAVLACALVSFLVVPYWLTRGLART
ncbi:MAG: hypothetical protein K0U79_01635 [Gammaproteobacteria bacterium]|mgnify:CR=1 FL=1|nr:hypothetical protein [Gammaproteobacteria bacterium]